MAEILVSLSRGLLGAYLIWNAINHYRNLGALTGYALYKGVPYAKPLVVVSGWLLAVTGLGIVGVVPGELGAAAALLFFIPVSFKIHDYWNIHVPIPTPGNATEIQENTRARQMEQVHFTKNLAILAGLLIALLA